MTQAWYGFQRKTITIDKPSLTKYNIVDLLLKPSIPRALRQNSHLALNQIELDATNRSLVILSTEYDKAEYPAKMRDNYCPHLNPSR
jgi:hypothetical protein